MIDALPYRASMRPVSAIDGVNMSVTLSGPAQGRTVVVCEERTGNSQSYAALRERLHLAMFRTVGIAVHNGLTAKSIVRFLDQYKISGGLLVGDRAGGELAW